MPGPDTLTKLQRVMRLAYTMRKDEEAVLAREIYAQREAAWIDEMRQQAAQVGVRARIPSPRGEYADLMRRESITDAHSIRNTFNRDLEREIERLYTANPRGNRYYYMRGIERWQAERAQWKQRQIALVNDKTARHWAQQAFVEENLITGTYRFIGPAPVCDDCAAQFAAGVVTQDYVDQNPTPLHPNCPHGWKLSGAQVGVPIGQLWVG